MSEHPSNYCPVFGNYPKEYNRAVHGPYYPWVDYGRKPDQVNFTDTKLGDLKNWFSKADKSPAALTSAFSRQYHLWAYNWYHTRWGSPSKPLFQLSVLMSVTSLLVSYGYYRNHRTHKYHW